MKGSYAALPSYRSENGSLMTMQGFLYGISALVVQAGTATSTRARGEKNSFNLMRVSPRHIEVDQYSWEDGDFTCAGTEKFDHTGEGWTLGDGPL